MTTTRRLAAILAADVAGYSALMGLDEEGTLARLTAHRGELVDPTIAKHRGRIVKTTGDGMLVEFGSVVDAVRAAVELQRNMIARNVDVPEQNRIRFRIGITVGDIIFQDGDIFGDGVNIAARLEGIAEPDGLCISDDAWRQVQGKLQGQHDVAFEDMGEQQLKNIATPVRAFRAQLETAGTGAQRPARTSAIDKPSIAVLPLANMSGDTEQQYFSDGITEDIITELSRFRQLHVLARNSSFRYRGSDLDMLKVGRELNVHYLVEGSVRRLGPRVRITAQLIDARSGHHIWAEKFDRDLTDLFAVQDEVVRTIVATVAGRLQAVGAEVAARKPPASLAAYELVLRADALPLNDPGKILEARQLFEKAMALDPGYARAPALLAINLIVEWLQLPATPNAQRDRALELARKAVALDPNDAGCHVIMGQVALDCGLHDQAEHHYQRALDLNRNNSLTMAGLGVLHNCLGNPTKGIAYFKEALALDPNFAPSWYWSSRASAHYGARQYAEAIAASQRVPRATWWSETILAASHAQLENAESARRHLAEALRLAPYLTISHIMTRQPFKLDSDRQHAAEGLRKAGLRE
jgi:adenylate cyclase